MSEARNEIKLQDGTLIRHKKVGYEGQIEGTTEIKSCFTHGGESLGKISTKEIFQYRVLIKGESTRQIAPAEDLEILEEIAQVICPRCHSSFQSKPGLADKPRGRCQCGGWICPFCSACQDTTPCVKQRQRLARKLALKKKVGGH